jgi:hypothetical protein
MAENKLVNDISADYCNREIADLLRKHGAELNRFGMLIGSNGQSFITCTHAVALKWLRINFDIWIEIAHVDDTMSFYYYPTITTGRDRNWYDEDMIDQAKTIDDDTIAPNSCFLNPEEAMEAALLYILKNLI